MTSAREPRGLIICLPVAEVDDYIGVVETLIQEGFAQFALPAQSEGFSEILGIFGTRASFGVYRADSAAQVISAVEAGGSFVLLDVPDPAAIAAAIERGIHVYGGAMTPSEIRAVLDTGATGALVFPADVVGHALGARLAQIGLGDRVLPLGGVGAYAAGEWLSSGAKAVCIEATLLGDAFDGGSLAKLRDRSGSFIAVQRKFAQTTN